MFNYLNSDLFHITNYILQGVILMNDSTIMAILIDKRTDAAPTVQKILTEHGCIIKTRLGMHESGNCADEGMIILDLTADDSEVDALEAELKSVDGVRVKSMVLDFG